MDFYLNNKKTFPAVILLMAILLSFVACELPKEKPIPISEPEIQVDVPSFNRDSVYGFVKRQVGFGPRIPETEEHAACSEWLKESFESFGWQVQFQAVEIAGFDENRLKIRNIIATINPEKEERILLCAHWDTRRMADQDQDSLRRDKPALGADDGASGVAVLLEIARVIGENSIDLGVEIVLFDAEDQGESGTPRPSNQTWCLGSQYWSKNPHEMIVSPRFGILLDMVGAVGAQFPQEGVSVDRAFGIVSIVWNHALRLRYDNFFISQRDDDIVDDHLFVNDIARIPTIDIINRQPRLGANGRVITNTKGGLQRKFPKHWHTHSDNMSVIDRHTLGAVGDVLLQVLYREAAQ
jgi:glutaminyl-peptide cyclotransferase